MMTHIFDLNKPSHLIANDVLRQLEILMSGSGLHVTFGVQSHELIEDLVAQYQDKLMETHNRSRDNIRAEVLKQETEDEMIEKKLRDMFIASHFPVVEDVYVSTSYCAYVTFSEPLGYEQIMFADAALNLDIERVFPLRNRYRVTFKAPDTDED